MTDCACSIDCDSEEATFYKKTTPKARKDHKCHECNRNIAPGEVYERVKAVWDMQSTTHKTCSDCMSVRDAMFRAYNYGTIWEDVTDAIIYGYEFPSEHCLLMMTPAGRGQVLEIIDDTLVEKMKERS